MDPAFAVGAVCLVALVAIAWGAARARDTTPITFGILWFLLALMPTSSVVPLFQVVNDHRTFFPYIGLTIAGSWALFLVSERVSGRWPAVQRLGVIGAAAVLLIAGHAAGTYQRNEVWHSEQSLWYDVTRKSPSNARGLMNYGLSQMRIGEYERALEYFTRSVELDPRYAYVHINLGVLMDAIGTPDAADGHFRDAIGLRPDLADGYLYYGRFLRSHGRAEEARANLEQAVRLSPGLLEARYELMGLYVDTQTWGPLRTVAADTLAMAPTDERARRFLDASDEGSERLASTEILARSDPTPERWLQLSLEYHRTSRYEESLDAARESLRLRPDYAAALNNIAAAQIELGEWAEAIEAATRAVEPAPAFDLARNNLTRARRLLGDRILGQRSTDEATLLDVSVRLYREGAYDDVLTVCERILTINPRSVPAHNNVCSAYNALGRWDEAIAACETALGIDPTHELATNNLAWARRQRSRERWTGPRQGVTESSNAIGMNTMPLTTRSGPVWRNPRRSYAGTP